MKMARRIVGQRSVVKDKSTVSLKKRHQSTRPTLEHLLNKQKVRINNAYGHFTGLAPDQS